MGCGSSKDKLMMHEDLLGRLEKLFAAVDEDGNGNLEPEAH